MFYMLLPTADMRQNLIEHMKSNGIHCVFHYIPLHLSAMGEKQGANLGDCPVSEDISQRLVRLPFYNKLSSEEQNDIIQKVLRF